MGSEKKKKKKTTTQLCGHWRRKITGNTNVPQIFLGRRVIGTATQMKKSNYGTRQSAQRKLTYSDKVTNQDKVRSRYPHASAEQESIGEWGVWDISHDERKRLDEAHWPATHGRGLFGLGRTEAEAWADAVQKIEQREGRRLPVPNV